MSVKKREKYLFLFLVILLIVSCGWKTRVSCQVDDKAETLEQIGQGCWEQPEFGVKKEF